MKHARYLLDRLLKSHGLTIEDLDSTDQEKDWCEFSYRTRTEKDLLIQCIIRAANTTEVEGGRYRGGRRIRVMLTKLQQIEAESLYGYYRPLLKQEMSNLFLAFTAKHRLCTDSVPDDGPSGLTRDQLLRLARLMQSLKDSSYTGTRRQLNPTVKPK